MTALAEEQSPVLGAPPAPPVATAPPPPPARPPEAVAPPIPPPAAPPECPVPAPAVPPLPEVVPPALPPAPVVVRPPVPVLIVPPAPVALLPPDPVPLLPPVADDPPVPVPVLPPVCVVPPVAPPVPVVLPPPDEHPNPPANVIAAARPNDTTEKCLIFTPWTSLPETVTSPIDPVYLNVRGFGGCSAPRQGEIFSSLASNTDSGAHPYQRVQTLPTFAETAHTSRSFASPSFRRHARAGQPRVPAPGGPAPPGRFASAPRGEPARGAQPLSRSERERAGW